MTTPAIKGAQKKLSSFSSKPSTLLLSLKLPGMAKEMPSKIFGALRKPYMHMSVPLLSILITRTPGTEGVLLCGSYIAIKKL